MARGFLQGIVSLIVGADSPAGLARSLQTHEGPVRPKAVCWQNSLVLGGGQSFCSIQTFN